MSLIDPAYADQDRPDCGPGWSAYAEDGLGRSTLAGQIRDGVETVPTTPNTYAATAERDGVRGFLAPPRARAFTVIEIMLAMSLLAIIIVGLLAMFYQVQRAFRLGTAQVDVMEGGRATMGLLTRELQELVPTQVEGVTNFVVVPSLGGAFTNQKLPSGNLRTNYLRDLCFVSKLDNDQWVWTTYRISNAVSGVGTLYRFVTNAYVEPVPLLARPALGNLSRLMCEARPDKDGGFHPVVDGVVHFAATAYDLRGRLADTNAFPAIGLGYAYRDGELPAYVDLEMAVLETGAVEKFRARSAIDATRAATFLEQQIGRTHVFRQRVAIRAGSSTNSFR